MSKRLLSINNYHYRRAGVDVVFLEHNSLFAEAGWQTATFSMQHPSNEPSRWSRHFVQEVTYAAETSMAQRVRGAASVLYSLEARRKLRGLLNEFAPDVVHVHSVYHHISPSVLSMLAAMNLPIVLTAHDYKLLCPAYKMFDGNSVCERCKGGRYHNLLRKRCIYKSLPVSTLAAAEAGLHAVLGSYSRNVSYIVAPSKFMRSKFIEWGWPADRVVHIPNFIDAATWDAQPNIGNYVLYAGRLAPEKGLFTLLDAAASADAPLVVAGDGPLRDQLVHFARSRNIRVKFVGHVTQDEVQRLLAGSRCAVLPAQWYENAPLSILEAFAVARPVLAARIGGIPEMVTPDVGWLHTAGNSKELAAQLRSVMEMPDEQLLQMGLAARRRAEVKYARPAYLQRMNSLYEQATTGQSKA